MKRIAVAAVTVMITGLIGWTPAQAASCPPASIGGPAVASIKVGKKTVPVKSVTYKKGGPLLPPATNQAAGLSRRNAPLHAKKGSTVITWHVRYGPGCPGTLNALTTLPIGTTFTVGKVGKTPKTYQIARREIVKKGVLKKRWFSTTGPRRLTLITCNDLQGSRFVRTMVVIATPVTTTPTTTAPASS